MGMKAKRILEDFGVAIPVGSVIHHIDGNPKNNDFSNLMVCKNHRHHTTIHLEEKAYEATGDKSKRKCRYCKKWDDTTNLKYYGGSNKNHKVYHHPKCASQVQTEWAKNNREKYNKYQRDRYRRKKLERIEENK